MENKVPAVYCTTVQSYHALKKKPCYYMVQGWVVTMCLKLFTTSYYCSRSPCISIEVLCQKQKPQFDRIFQSVLHILGQEKYCSWKTRSLRSTDIKGYHVFLLQVVHQHQNPQINCLFLIMRHILGHIKFSFRRTRVLHLTANRGFHICNEKPGYYMVQ